MNAVRMCIWVWRLSKANWWDRAYVGRYARSLIRTYVPKAQAHGFWFAMKGKRR